MMLELACCLIITAASLFYIFICPASFISAPKKLVPDIFASAKMRSTKICAT